MPGEGRPAAGVVGAGHADLVAVVDARRAGHGHLEEYRQAQSAGIAVDHPGEAGGIVAVNQVQLRQGDLPIVSPVQRFQVFGKGDGVAHAQVVAAGFLVTAVIGFFAEELHRQRHENVIHDGVELVALQPAAAIAPNLADNVGLGVGLAHPAAEFLPEGVIVNLVGHIQPPAVNAEIHPVTGHIQQVGAGAGIMGVELGQPGQVGPGGVVQALAPLARVGVERPVVHSEPIQVG